MKSLRFRGKIPAVVAVVLVALLAACGVPADSHPRPIPGTMPFGLLDPSTTASPTTVPAVTVPAKIYLLSPAHLQAVNRMVAAPLMVGGVLNALTQGPTEAESAAGLRSALSPQTRVVGAQVVGSLATVNVSNAFTGLGLQDQIFAAAQLVFTATEISDVQSVQIDIDSVPVGVPRGDGGVTQAPLHRSDYAQLAPPH